MELIKEIPNNSAVQNTFETILFIRIQPNATCKFVIIIILYILVLNYSN
jgi:hypothetical protein